MYYVIDKQDGHMMGIFDDQIQDYKIVMHRWNPSTWPNWVK